MKKLILTLLLSIKYTTHILSASYITNIGPVQLITTNGLNSFSSGTINLYGNINIGNSNNDIITLQGANIIRPTTGNNSLIMINSTGNLITANTTHSSFTCGPLTASNFTTTGSLNSGTTTVGTFSAAGSAGQSVTLGNNTGIIVIKAVGITYPSSSNNSLLMINSSGNIITGTTTNSSFTCGSLTCATGTGQSVTLGNNAGTIIMKASGITNPSPSNNSLLMINSSGNIITGTTTNSSFTCGSFAAAFTTGQTITLGNNTGTGNYITFASNIGDIIIQSNISNGNIRLNTAMNTGNIIFTSTGITPTANAAPAATILAIDRAGNVITSNLSNIFKLGSDADGDNFIAIDNATPNNGIQIKSSALSLTANPGYINLQGSGIIYPNSNEYNLLTIDSFGNLITNTLINSPLTCNSLTADAIYGGNFIAASNAGQSVILGNTAATISIAASGITYPSAGQYNIIYIDSNGYLKTQNSSKMYKENIKKIDIVDDYFDQLQLCSFNYKNDEYKKIRYGFIAEELMNIPFLKDTIIYDKTGNPLNIDYEKIWCFMASNYLLHKKKSNIKIQNFKNEIEKFRDEIENFRHEIENFKHEREKFKHEINELIKKNEELKNQLFRNN
jgi:hypothetical protein